jgi:hypothetical protein
MSFAECRGRLFTEASIRKNAPEVSGIYGLSNAREWLFIGETNNIQKSLLKHLVEIDKFENRTPAGFVYEPCSPVERIARQDALVRQFEPFYNRRIDYANDPVHRLE